MGSKSFAYKLKKIASLCCKQMSVFEDEKEKVDYYLKSGILLQRKTEG